MTAGKVRLIAILVLVGIAVIICLSGIYVVNPGEQAVVLTFGHHTDTTDSGIHFSIPLVQQVRKMSTSQQHQLEYGYRTTRAATTAQTAQYEDHPEESIMLTSDQNIVSVEAVFQYYVADAAEYLYNVDDQEGTLRCAFETVLRRNLQNRTLDDALLNKEEIASQVLPDFQEMLKPYGLGVTVKAVMIQNIAVPTEVQAAYEDVNNALTEKTKNLDEAEKYKNQVVPAAEAQAYKMEQDAQAYSARTIASANGEVAQFNDVYAKYVDNKEITRKRLLIEALESILNSADKLYMVDDGTGTLKILGLDGSVLPQATAAPQPTAAAGGN